MKDETIRREKAAEMNFFKRERSSRRPSHQGRKQHSEIITEGKAAKGNLPRREGNRGSYKGRRGKIGKLQYKRKGSLRILRRLRERRKHNETIRERRQHKNLQRKESIIRIIRGRRRPQAENRNTRGGKAADRTNRRRDRCLVLESDMEIYMTVWCS